MRFSIPTETGLRKSSIERRVLSPAGVHELCLAGAEVFVQQHAGRGAGFTDEAYRTAGAHLVYTAAEAYGRADVVLRVERPREEDWALLPDGSTLIAFLHLHTAPTSVKQTLMSRHITALGLEALSEDDGSFPLQKVSSQITGRMAPNCGRLLNRQTGMGVLLPGLPGIPPADVVILGAGVLGAEAARAFSALARASTRSIPNSTSSKRWTTLSGKVVTALATAQC
jgi:alanine dehydrogenase